MSRRRRNRNYIEHHENRDRWLVSYADFITLLFAFFVVMYSISSVNVGKYRALSESIHGAFETEGLKFSDSPLQKTSINSLPIQVGDPATSMIEPIKLTHLMHEDTQQEITSYTELLDEKYQLGLVASQFESVLDAFINDDLVDVKKNHLWLEIEIKSKMLFASGDTVLRDEARPVLKKISEVLREISNVVHVEGHTDNIPIETIEFPSNWDLSAARAVSVVREFVLDGIDPVRLAAVGYGENHPVADNKLEEGRSKNRRVTLVVMSSSLTRHAMKADKQSTTIAE